MNYFDIRTYRPLLLLILLVPIMCQAQESKLPENVSSNGKIELPNDFQVDYVFLGSWFLDLKEQKSKLMQHVYTRKQDLIAYQQSGQWPDGAVVVKEQIKVVDSDIGVAVESYAEKTNGFFVMVKDRENHFPDNPLWGDGWGWSFLDAKDLSQTTTTDYKKDCLGCHEPVRDTDLIFIKGYPLLNGG